MKVSLIFALTTVILFLPVCLLIGCTGNPIQGSEEDCETCEIDDADNAVKGAIIGYAAGWRPAPTDAQLDMLTHVMVFQIIPNADGSLKTNSVLKNLDQFVTRSHAKNVKVSIAVGGWIDNVSPNHTDFASAASSAYRATFVQNLVDYVNQYNLDGIDIDWEFPQGAQQFNDFISLCGELKAALPSKRVSAAVQGYIPNNNSFPGNVRSGIWNALDAIHLMSYDMGWDWVTHSDAIKSKQLIDAWANWGKGQPGFKKEKLILGCAFYSAHPGPWLEYNNGAQPPHCDGRQSLTEKVDHCYDNGYGGVMIWELSYDKNISSVPELLSFIYSATQAKGGYTGKK